MQKNDFFTFGKHKGKTLAYVLQHDYQYVSWCQANVRSFYVEGSTKKIKMSPQEIEIRSILSDMCLRHYEKHRKTFNKGVKPKDIKSVICNGCKMSRLCNG